MKKSTLNLCALLCYQICWTLCFLSPAACKGAYTHWPTVYRQMKSLTHKRHTVDTSQEIVIPADGPHVGQKEEDTWNDYLNTLFDPAFDTNVASNVSAVVGQMAHLPCRVNNLGTKTVSWIRHHDTHILTVGSFTYSGDTRFSALHREGTNEWTLQIKNPSTNDSGLYECQVSTKPVRAYLVKLRVVIPTARILHSPELHANEGGVLNLTCIVSPSPGAPEYIFWHRQGEVINYESDQRVQVYLRQENDHTISNLIVSPATLNHSGIYRCEPSNTNSTQITVHIFKAEEPAAMQTSKATSFRKLSKLSSFLMQLLIIYACLSHKQHV